MEEKDTKLISNKLMTIFIIIVSIVMIYTIITSFFMTGVIYDKYGPPDMEKLAEDMHISPFNSQFMKYEGIRSSQEIKQLIEVVNESNLIYGPDVIVSINGNSNIGDNQYIFKGDIKKKYEVKIEKVDGLVNNIIINEIEEGDYNNETY